jgi:hypothetical protein
LRRTWILAFAFQRLLNSFLEEKPGQYKNNQSGVGPQPARVLPLSSRPAHSTAGGDNPENEKLQTEFEEAVRKEKEVQLKTVK